ncbi:hypothetical protein [Candidatus Amarolinea dominans]|uniref:hypothetical protein n=1 Tax=Candidatus Amarolinea dominans TaxID=3140696 RepID=UPI001D5423B2|nr:hypothetical protein [Anaerolineae bacterium]
MVRLVSSYRYDFRYAHADSTNTPTPTSTPANWPPDLIEDFELGLGSWYNDHNDLDHFDLVSDACQGSNALHMGGTDEGNSWVGEAVIGAWGARPSDWRNKAWLPICLKRGETVRQAALRSQ